MNSFEATLATGGILVADGATGTNLQRAGLLPGVHTEDWVLEQPEKVVELERQFVEAGSQIILTCTFGGTALRMKSSPYADRAAELNEKAASLARQASNGHDILVAGSMGPVGQLLQPYGPITYEQAVESYAQQARALAAGHVDLLVIETQFSLEEARAAFDAARRETDLPTVVSFSYDRGTRTVMGVKPETVATTFRDLGAAMVGVNCGTTLENAAAIVREYAASAPGFPIWVKPNAGLPRLEGGLAVYDVLPAAMAEFAVSVVGLGARVVGGCCGSTPAHVKAIADSVSDLIAKVSAGD